MIDLMSSRRSAGFVLGYFLFFKIISSSASPVDNEISTTDDNHPFEGGPIIDPPRSDIVLQKGQNYTLYCKGNEKIQFKQQEIPEDVIGPFHTKIRDLVLSESTHKYGIALDLVNVDQFAVGYYACFDSTINSSEVLNTITEEPNNTAHISYIYVYVNGTDTLFAPMREMVYARSGAEVVIECRPTVPDTVVQLKTSDNRPQPYLRFSPKTGFIIKSRKVTFHVKCKGDQGNETVWKTVRYIVSPPPKPKVYGGSKYYLDQETFTLNCTVAYQVNSAVLLSWNLPNYHQSKESTITYKQNKHAITDGILYNNLTIFNATKEHAGRYECVSKNSYDESKTAFNKTYLEKAFINLTKGNKADPIETKMSFLRLQVTIQDYPKADVEFFKDSMPLVIRNKSKHEFSRNNMGSITLVIRNLTVYDTGNYTLVAKNKFTESSARFDVRVLAEPIVDFVISADKRYTLNSMASLRCNVAGYPLAEVTWTFESFSDDSESGDTATKGVEKMTSINEMTSYLDIPVRTSGNITCNAVNSIGRTSVTQTFLVHEIANGFGIVDAENVWFSENQNVKLKCIAAKSDFINVTWTKDDDDFNEQLLVTFSETANSFVAQLTFDHITLDQEGNYTCLSNTIDGDVEFESISITVAGLRDATILEPVMDTELEVHPYQPMQLTCLAFAVPLPTVEWYKDGVLLEPDSKVEIIVDNVNLTTVNSTLNIRVMEEEYKGNYECLAKSSDQVDSRFISLFFNEKPIFKTTYLAIIVAIFLILLILVIYLFWKIRKEKRFRKELAAAGLLYFKEGVPKSINPDLGIDEQAELLPYDEKFEFPPDKLKLGKQLGAGAFGVVYKAEARGILNAEETTTVAVKMVKKTADNMYIKALASELKIMVHMGKHVNIVNLLGACTKNVGKRELIVIVEYCKFGNIHNYLQKHRDVFIDQFNHNNDNHFGRVNRGFSSSSNTGNNSDYFASPHTQNTEHTFINSSNTNRSSRKVSETGYLQPEWRSNYESDYSYDGRTPRPLTSRDLVCWAFQIARGMEYLASRKVLHGDLAARNILLADDNVVKICDFGLAKSIYKNDEYQKQENSPLPVKWLAIECMMDRIFSTQSDVWSFGIVLWEMFSLAKTPYPNIPPQHLLQWLNEGNRLSKPAHADDRLYEVMLKCWDQKPTARPSFSKLQETLGTFLEDNVRNHYVDLNASCQDVNAARHADGGEDYLAIVSAPDYNSLLTPSAHHYVNETSFFPPSPNSQLQHDDEGYLQMSPATEQAVFSTRPHSAKFDFDARKLNSRANDSEDTNSEFTPMLTLGGGPRSSSESDHEAGSPPYLNMCPRIEEEADDVFEYNTKNKKSDAVTNPTYITLDTELEKKPKDIISNSYVNVSAPNGLVK